MFFISISGDFNRSWFKTQNIDKINNYSLDSVLALPATHDRNPPITRVPDLVTIDDCAGH